jgi:hypothetical protein
LVNSLAIIESLLLGLISINQRIALVLETF